MEILAAQPNAMREVRTLNGPADGAGDCRRQRDGTARVQYPRILQPRVQAFES